MMHALLPLLALVQEEGPPPGGGMNFLFPLLLVFAIFYFLVMRPEKRNRQRHQAMLAELKKGDKVVTSGGMYATVVSVGDGLVTLQIADNVRAKFTLQAIQGRVEESEPEPAIEKR